MLCPASNLEEQRSLGTLNRVCLLKKYRWLEDPVGSRPNKSRTLTQAHCTMHTAQLRLVLRLDNLASTRRLNFPLIFMGNAADVAALWVSYISALCWWLYSPSGWAFLLDGRECFNVFLLAGIHISPTLNRKMVKFLICRCYFLRNDNYLKSFLYY